MVHQHEIDHIDDLTIERVDLMNVRYTSARASRGHRFFITASARDYYTDDRTGAFIRGDRTPARFQEFWIFHYLNDRWLLRESSRRGIEPPSPAQLRGADDERGGQLHRRRLAGAAAVTASDSRLLSFARRRALDSLSGQDPMWDQPTMLLRARRVRLHHAGPGTGRRVPSRPDLLAAAMDRLQRRIADLRQDGKSVESREI